jgi:hypothetical protein
MKDKTSASLEALTGLLSERQRYEEWLSALESRKSNTPDSVYQKVSADYQGRLKDVSDRLGSRAGELKAHIDALTSKLGDISRDETAQHESRQEAEVRAAVGEYTDEEWQRIKQESEKELARIARDRTSTETQLAELNRVFTLSTNPAAAAAVVGTIPPLAPVAPPKSAAPADQNGTAKRPAGGTSGWPQRDGDAGVISVSPDNDRGAAAKSGGQDSPFDGFSDLSKKSGAASVGAEKAEEPKPTSTATATPTKAKRVGGLPDLRTEQQKTLKCPECAAMNYPTEWYCERCGGELATL